MSMFETVIRPMVLKDVDSVLSIEDVSFPTPWNRNMFCQELDLSFSRHLIASTSTAERNAEIVGYIVFWIIQDETQLQRIAVKNDLRQTGIGGLLIKEMISMCRTEGVVRGSLEVRSSNHAALSLYKKNGFVINGTRKGYYTDTREDALIMCFDIDII